MKLSYLLSEMSKVHKEIGTSEPYICGGTPRDKILGSLKKIYDLDITTGDKTVDYLSQKFYNKFSNKLNIHRKIMSDGHSSIFFGNLKIDFSSNFNNPDINSLLSKQGINNPTEMEKEIFSRDFTCNALLIPLDLSKVIDITNHGLKDIKEKKIRTCLAPEITLINNKNRVVRSIYLSCKLGFDIDQSIINFVSKNPKTIKISSSRTLAEKINESFKIDADKASYLLTKMGLWNYIPISDVIYPYYIKKVKSNVTK